MESPLLHFTPPRGWMNDPNGLVHHDGEYHLCYQHNPDGDEWAAIGWGHAVSRDLLRWEHLPVAIPALDGEMAFSGSAVVDGDRLVAIYTAGRGGHQAQALAVSGDRGRRWERFAGNPVLDIGSAEFRDPKVFRHGERWIMAVALSVERRIAFYASEDLIAWTRLSCFGPAGSVDGVWECPDLFPLELDGEVRWVLVVSVGGGGVAGGSGTQYFVGDFDGERFVDDGEPVRWLDHGMDHYAAVSWEGAPDGRRVMIGWMSNWRYAHALRRSAMSLPRDVALRTVGGRAQLVQAPVVPAGVLEPGERGTVRGSRELGVSGTVLDLRVTLEPGDASRCGVRLLGDTVVGYADGAVFVSRSGGPPGFAGVHRVPVALRDGRIDLRIVADRWLVEVFAGGGEATLADQVVPSGDALHVFAIGGSAAYDVRAARWA